MKHSKKAYAAVMDDYVGLWSVSGRARDARDEAARCFNSVNLKAGWKEAKANGYRIVPIVVEWSE